MECGDISKCNALAPCNRTATAGRQSHNGSYRAELFQPQTSHTHKPLAEGLMQIWQTQLETELVSKSSSDWLNSTRFSTGILMVHLKQTCCDAKPHKGGRSCRVYNCGNERLSGSTVDFQNEKFAA